MVLKCRQLISLVGRVDVLGPKQIGKALDLVIGGTIGYYGRATPLRFQDCEDIEQERRRILESRQICPSTPRLPAYLSQDTGGLGHTHAYQWAAAAYVDQVDRAIN